MLGARRLDDVTGFIGVHAGIDIHLHIAAGTAVLVTHSEGRTLGHACKLERFVAVAYLLARLVGFFAPRVDGERFGTLLKPLTAADDRALGAHGHEPTGKAWTIRRNRTPAVLGHHHRLVH